LTAKEYLAGFRRLPASAYRFPLLGRRLLLALAVFSLTRLCFYACNRSFFADLPPADVLALFLAGLRFDLAALAYLYGIVALLHFVPARVYADRRFRRVLKRLFLTLSGLVLIFGLADSLFFPFQQKRLTAEIFSGLWLGADFLRLLPRLLADYWYAVVGIIILLIGVARLYPADGPPPPSAGTRGWAQRLAGFSLGAATVLLFVVLARGGLQLRPLTPLSAVLSAPTAAGLALVQNTPFTLLHSLAAPGMPRLGHFSRERLAALYDPEQRYPDRPFRPRNVVIIILESFGRELVGALHDRPGAGHTPFLDTLIGEGLVFSEAYANGVRSMEALPAILAGIPSYRNEPYLMSAYTANRILALPAMLARHGYHTALFHGGHNGTMAFDQFARLAGFAEYCGLDEYDGPAAGLDGSWGVYDEEFLQYAAARLAGYAEPFMAVVFTLSSHHPYKVPERYRERFAAGATAFQRSIAYADYSLGRFFERARQEGWYSNTLFVLVADHGAPEGTPPSRTSQGIYRIPLLFHAPYDPRLRGRDARIAQQTDIFPTVVDLLGLDAPLVAFGRSLLGERTEPYALAHAGGLYTMVGDGECLLHDGTQPVAFYHYADDPLLLRDLRTIESQRVGMLEIRLKAILQSWNNRLLDDALWPETPAGTPERGWARPASPAASPAIRARSFQG
jgi:hypothetical protein